MSTLFFNTSYKIMNSITEFTQCIDYYNRDDRADKNLLEQKSYEKDAEEMFSYYFYRKGSCGCFDFSGDKSYEKIMEEYQQYKPNYIWRSVISFTKEDAVEFGLIEKSDFSSLTKRVVIKMAQEKGIALRDVIWGGFYHVNTANPHVHFYFYDRNNPLDHDLFSKKSIEKIRATIAREVLDRSLLLKDKEDTSRKIIENIRSITNDKVLIDELKKYRTNRNVECQNFVSTRFKIRKEIFIQLQKLDDILPKRGRLSYNSYALKDYKEEIDNLITLLLKQKDLKDDFNIYKKQLNKVYESNEKLYGSSSRLDDYINDQLQRLYSSLGNAILKMIKSFREYEETLSELKYEAYMKLGDVKKEKIKKIKPYGYDLMRYSFQKMRHEISVLKQLQRIRERGQREMILQVEREQKDKEREEEVKYGSS